MAFTSVITHATGDVFPAADWNTYIRDNMAYLHGDAGVVQLANAISTGPSTGSAGDAADGVYLTTNGTINAVAAASTNAILLGSIPGDSFSRFNVTAAGAISWGPGTGAQDAHFGRLASGVIGDTATAISTGPTTGASGGGGATGVYLSTNGLIQLTLAATTSGAFQAAVANDSTSRYVVTADGTVKWGPGTGGQDTTLARASAGALNLSNNLAMTYVNTTGGAATWTPTWTNGLVQRYNMNATGTLTIASPGTPPTNTSAMLYLIIHNASGGTITLSWNAIFNQTPAAPANGQGTVIPCVYNPGTSKWEVMQTSVE